MKTIIKSLFAIFVLLGTGCSDDFFDKSPQGSLDPSKIDETLVVNLRNAVYNLTSGSDVAFTDGYADNGYSRNSWDSNGMSVQTNTLSADEDYGYASNYNGIRTCNLLIDKIDEFEKVEPALRKKYSAEARVMRAWLYMNLTLYFGDVPLVATAVNDYPGGLARTPSKEVREWILKELDEAFTILPEKNDKGAFNKAMTYAIKARAAYYFGNYDLAEKAARYVIDNGGYQLYSVSELSDSMKKDAEFFKKLVDFNSMGVDEQAFVQGIFNYQNIWNVDNNSETIIAKEYTATEEHGDFNRVTSFLTPNLVAKQAWATIVPIQDLVDAYWTVDGKNKPTLPSVETRITNFKSLSDKIKTLRKGPDGLESTTNDNLTFSQAVNTIVNSIASEPYMSQYKNRDSRLYASIIFPFSAINKYVAGEYQEYQADIVNYGRSGFAFRKMSGADDAVSVWGDDYFMSGADFPVIRLAEMLLIFAESHTQKTGYDASVTTELNKLRTRCGMPAVPAGMGKAQAIDFIRAERRIELAGEGLRFYDIRLYEDNQRNGGFTGTEAASTVMKGQTYDVIGNLSALKTWENRLMYMPLPVTSMDKNPALIQNKGY